MNTDIAAINPVPEGVARPLWSVMIPTYNCADYLVETLKSVLAQDPGSEIMQIEVVDDGSSKDDPEAVVREIGQGRVSFYRQPQNVGAPANFTTCIQRSRGHWLHILHGDDILLPGFYAAYQNHIETHNCSMVVAQAVLIDDKGEKTGVSNPIDATDGLIENPLEIIIKNNPIRTPTVVVAREAYEKVGGFNISLVHANDWEIWTRLATVGAVGYVEKPYALYRNHEASDTSKLTLSGVYITDTLKALKVVQSRLNDAKLRQQIQDWIYERKGKAAYNNSRKLAQKGYYQPALKSAYWAMKLQPSIRTFSNLGYVALKGIGVRKSEV